MFGKLSNKADVEDVVSEVFLKVCEKYQTFDADRASAATWVHHHRNTVIDYFRAHRICTELPEDLPDEAVWTMACCGRTLRTLGEALSKLDDRSRALIVLRYYKRMSSKDTAWRGGVSCLRQARCCIRRPLGLLPETHGRAGHIDRCKITKGETK